MEEFPWKSYRMKNTSSKTSMNTIARCICSRKLVSQLGIACWHLEKDHSLYFYRTTPLCHYYTIRNIVCSVNTHDYLIAVFQCDNMPFYESWGKLYIIMVLENITIIGLFIKFAIFYLNSVLSSVHFS